jgi:outer membrane receptor protein involved in Fe transport
VQDNKQKDGNTLLGLYLQDEWRPVEKLKINYGLRYDRMSALVTADQISPRVGMTYDLTPATVLHAAYARYFTPQRNDFMSPNLALFANTSNAPENTVASPAMPERSHYFDAGATHMLTPHLGLGVDGFYKKITDLLDEGRFGQALIFTPFNYQEGKIYGVEFTAHYRKGNLNTYANLARTVSMGKGIVTGQFNFDQELLNHAASNWVNTDHDQRYTSSAGISYLWLGTLFSANANYGSGLRRGFANSEQMPHTFQVNLGATHLFNVWELGPVEGRLGIINALDRVNHIRDGSGIGVGAPQFGPRIGAFAGISKSF